MIFPRPEEPIDDTHEPAEGADERRVIAVDERRSAYRPNFLSA